MRWRRRRSRVPLAPLAREIQRAGRARAVGAGDHLERLAVDRAAGRLSQLHGALPRAELGGAERVRYEHLRRQPLARRGADPVRQRALLGGLAVVFVDGEGEGLADLALYRAAGDGVVAGRLEAVRLELTRPGGVVVAQPRLAAAARRRLALDQHARGLLARDRENRRLEHARLLEHQPVRDRELGVDRVVLPAVLDRLE